MLTQIFVSVAEKQQRVYGSDWAARSSVSIADLALFNSCETLHPPGSQKRIGDIAFLIQPHFDKTILLTELARHRVDIDIADQQLRLTPDCRQVD